MKELMDLGFKIYQGLVGSDMEDEGMRLSQYLHGLWDRSARGMSAGSVAGEISKIEGLIGAIKFEDSGNSDEPFNPYTEGVVKPMLDRLKAGLGKIKGGIPSRVGYERPAGAYVGDDGVITNERVIPPPEDPRYGEFGPTGKGEIGEVTVTPVFVPGQKLRTVYDVSTGEVVGYEKGET